MYGNGFKSESYIYKKTKLKDGSVFIDRTPTLLDTTVSLLLAPLWVYPVFGVICALLPVLAFIFPLEWLSAWWFNNIGTILIVVNHIAFGIPIVTLILLVLNWVDKRFIKGDKSKMDEETYIKKMTGQSPKYSQTKTHNPASDDIWKRYEELVKNRPELKLK